MKKICAWIGLLVWLIPTLLLAASITGGKPIFLQPVAQCSFVFVAADTTKTCTLGTDFTNTELHSLKVVIPTFSATTPTATVSILDAAGSTIYSQAAIAESTTTYIPLSRPLTSGSSYVILLTTTAGTGGGTATIDSWIYK